MSYKEVTDPNILKQLETPSYMPPNYKEVKDPLILEKLNEVADPNILKQLEGKSAKQPQYGQPSNLQNISTTDKTWAKKWSPVFGGKHLTPNHDTIARDYSPDDMRWGKGDLRWLKAERLLLDAGFEVFNEGFKTSKYTTAPHLHVQRKDGQPITKEDDTYIQQLLSGGQVSAPTTQTKPKFTEEQRKKVREQGSAKPSVVDGFFTGLGQTGKSIHDFIVQPNIGQSKEASENPINMLYFIPGFGATATMAEQSLARLGSKAAQLPVIKPILQKISSIMGTELEPIFAKTFPNLYKATKEMSFPSQIKGIAQAPKGLPTEVVEKPTVVAKAPPEAGFIKLPVQTIPENVTIAEPVKDLTGFRGFIRSYIAPVREVAKGNPVAEEIANLGRKTMSDLNYYQQKLVDKIEPIFKGMSKVDKQTVARLLDRPITQQEFSSLSTNMQKAYTQSRQFTQEMKRWIQTSKMADVGKWSIPDDQYYPHIFVGNYEIQVGGKTIEGGFARNIGEALDKAKTYLKTNPSANINISPKNIGGDFSATLLSKKAFFRFINDVQNATSLNKNEILGMMKGVAAIKPRPKFVGNFQQRVANLGGYIDDPELAFKIYANRILRKRFIEPFNKQTSELLPKLPEGLKKYFTEYSETMQGKPAWYDKNFQLSKTIGKITGLQSKLKLGYNWSSALVNKLQPLQTAWQELGTKYLLRGNAFKKTAEGKLLFKMSRITGELPKHVTGEFIPATGTKWYEPLGIFNIAEKGNRQDVFSAGYLMAKEKLGMDKAAAINWAKDLVDYTQYIYDVSDLPKIMRTPLGKLAFQFKPFTINYIYQMKNLWENAFKSPENLLKATKFTGMSLALSGIKAIPYASKIGLLTYLGVKYPQFTHGILGLLGIDISSKTSAVDQPIPENLTQFLGVSAQDTVKLWDSWRTGNPEIALGTIPWAKNVYTAIASSDIKNPYKRERTQIEGLTPTERISMALGFKPLKLTTEQETQKYITEKQRKYNENRARIIDGMLRGKGAVMLGLKPAKITPELMREYNINIKSLINEAKAKQTPALERRAKNIPKTLRPELYPLIFKNK